MSDDLNQGTCVRSNGDERDRRWSVHSKEKAEEKHERGTQYKKREREREHELWKADVPQERSLRCSTQKMLK